ncbi:MAG: hypothetical protein WCT52_03285 [Candidatus Micrarchaeia archaeon]|jgi:hypothetical protein
MDTSPKKRLRNFELVLQDELMLEFGVKEGVFMLDHLKMVDMFGIQSEKAGVPVKFETLPLLGESCLDDIFGELFKNSPKCEKVLKAFRRAKETHLKNGGKQAAPWHDCAMNFNCNGEKECIAKKLMKAGRIKPMAQSSTDNFLSRNGINGTAKR